MPTIASSRDKGLEDRIQAHKKSDTHYVVFNPKSKSSYGVFKSTVTNTWYCTCPFAQKSGKVMNGSECKHLRRVLDKENGCGRNNCRAGKLCASCSFEERMFS